MKEFSKIFMPQVMDGNAVEELRLEGPGHWSFRVPKEVQGGVVLTVDGAVEGTTALMRLGEELEPGTSLPKYPTPMPAAAPFAPVLPLSQTKLPYYG